MDRGRRKWRKNRGKRKGKINYFLFTLVYRHEYLHFDLSFYSLNLNQFCEIQNKPT